MLSEKTPKLENNSKKYIIKYIYVQVLLNQFLANLKNGKILGFSESTVSCNLYNKRLQWDLSYFYDSKKYSCSYVPGIPTPNAPISQEKNDIQIDFATLRNNPTNVHLCLGKKIKLPGSIKIFFYFLKWNEHKEQYFSNRKSELTIITDDTLEVFDYNLILGKFLYDVNNNIDKYKIDEI